MYESERRKKKYMIEEYWISTDCNSDTVQMFLLDLIFQQVQLGAQASQLWMDPGMDFLQAGILQRSHIYQADPFLNVVV